MTEDEALLTVVASVIGALLSVLVGWSIGKQKGRGSDGAALGLLGPIGWIIVALLPEEGRRCPECRGVVPPEARRCKHCGVEFNPRPSPAPAPVDPVRLREILDAHKRRQ